MRMPIPLLRQKWHLPPLPGEEEGVRRKAAMWLSPRRELRVGLGGRRPGRWTSERGTARIALPRARSTSLAPAGWARRTARSLPVVRSGARREGRAKRKAAAGSDGGARGSSSMSTRSPMPIRPKGEGEDERSLRCRVNRALELLGDTPVPGPVPVPGPGPGSGSDAPLERSRIPVPEERSPGTLPDLAGRGTDPRTRVPARSSERTLAPAPDCRTLRFRQGRRRRRLGACTLGYDAGAGAVARLVDMGRPAGY